MVYIHGNHHWQAFSTMYLVLCYFTTHIFRFNPYVFRNTAYNAWKENKTKQKQDIYKD